MYFRLVIICTLASMLQVTFSQVLANGLNLNQNNNYNKFASNNLVGNGLAVNNMAANTVLNQVNAGLNGLPCNGSPSSSAQGYGEVTVTGELPVGGSTAVVGNVPVIGYITFEGIIPAGGSVSVAGNCGCNQQGQY